MPQQLLNRPQPHLLMYLITVIVFIRTLVIITFLDTVTLLSKSVIVLQKINKTNKKHFGGHPAF